MSRAHSNLQVTLYEDSDVTAWSSVSQKKYSSVSSVELPEKTTPQYFGLKTEDVL